MTHSADGMLLVPLAPGVDWAQHEGLAACEAPLAQGLAALAEAMEDGPVPCPDPLDTLHKRRSALLQDADAALTAHWRGALALCLLADAWQDGCAVTVQQAEQESGSLAAVLKEKIALVMAQGIPLGVADEELGLVPAAQTSDLAPLLPGRVSWYDAEAQTFHDPAEELNERDRALLMDRLACLKSAAAEKFLATLRAAALRPARQAAAHDEACLR